MPLSVSHPLVIVVFMNTAQLVLITPNHTSWSLDEETKRVGRNGLAQAREVLSRHNRLSAVEQIEMPIAA